MAHLSQSSFKKETISVKSQFLSLSYTYHTPPHDLLKMFQLDALTFLFVCLHVSSTFKGLLASLDVLSSQSYQLLPLRYKLSLQWYCSNRHPWRMCFDKSFAMSSLVPWLYSVVPPHTHSFTLTGLRPVLSHWLYKHTIFFLLLKP